MEKTYNDFFEFWNDKYSKQPEWVKQIALGVWDVCVNNFPVDTDIEYLQNSENIIRDLPDNKKGDLEDLDIDWLFLADNLAKLIKYLEAK